MAGASSALSSLAPLAAAAGPVAVAFVAVTAAVTAAAVGIKAFTSLVKKQADELSAYSPDVALASSQSDIRELRAMMRRAQRIGPDVSSWEKVRGEANEKMMDIWTEILDKLFEIAEPLLPAAKVAVDVLGLIPEFIEIVAEQGQAMVDVATLHWIDAGKHSEKALDAAQRLLKEASEIGKNTKKDDDPLDQWIQEFQQSLANRIAQDQRQGPPPTAPRVAIPPLNPFGIGAAGAVGAGGGA